VDYEAISGFGITVLYDPIMPQENGQREREEKKLMVCKFSSFYICLLSDTHPWWRSLRVTPNMPWENSWHMLYKAVDHTLNWGCSEPRCNPLVTQATINPYGIVS